MEKRTLRSDTLFAFISLVSLLYIYYYPSVYLKGIHFYTPFFDFVYFYLAVPAFGFFCSAFVVTALCTLFRFRGILPLRDKSAWLIGLVLLCYLVFVAAGVLGWVLPVLFGSAFCVVYVLFGAFFAFAFYQEVRL